MHGINVTIMNRQRKLPADAKLKQLITAVCRQTLDEQNFDGSAEVNVSLVSDNKIRILNRDIRNIDSATDVLSFPLGENGEYDVNPETGLYQLGDIVISLEHAAAQAEEYGHSYEREVGYLTAHSMLHLLGYDHVNNEQEAKIMRFHEEEIMKAVNLERKTDI